MPKQELALHPALMNAAGFLGFTPDLRQPQPWQGLGCFVTNPISYRPRLPAADAEILPAAGGFLLHTGLPNPGFTSVLRHFSARWQRAPLPILPHLMAEQPEETARMVRALEGLENVAAVELGFAPQASDELILRSVQAAAGELPVLANLAAERALGLGARLVSAGAWAVCAAPPRGLLVLENGRQVKGRWFSPALLPQTLLAAQEAARMGLLFCGGGGVFSKKDAQALWEAGAWAAQLDAVLWRGGFKEG
jgi:dihydroorotate dehydrogenase